MSTQIELARSSTAGCDTPQMPRSPRRIERVEFSSEEFSAVIESMEKLAQAGDGWINLIPQIDDHEEKSTSLGFFTLLSGGGMGVTMCTWIPRAHDHSGRDQPSLGITHATGHRAGAELYAHAVAIPEAWFVEQDHPRRGLVLRVPNDEPNDQVLTWSLKAMRVLSASQAITVGGPTCTCLCRPEHGWKFNRALEFVIEKPYAFATGSGSRMFSTKRTSIDSMHSWVIGE